MRHRASRADLEQQRQRFQSLDQLRPGTRRTSNQEHGQARPDWEQHQRDRSGVSSCAPRMEAGQKPAEVAAPLVPVREDPAHVVRKVMLLSLEQISQAERRCPVSTEQKTRRMERRRTDPQGLRSTSDTLAELDLLTCTADVPAEVPTLQCVHNPATPQTRSLWITRAWHQTIPRQKRPLFTRVRRARDA